MTAETPKPSEPCRRWQFSLWSIFVLTTIAAVVAAAVTGAFGIAVAQAILGCVICLLIILAEAIFVAILALFLVLTVWAVGAMPEKLWHGAAER